MSTSADPARVKQLAGEFVAEVNAVYGLYLDALSGFVALHADIQRGQAEGGANDDSPFFYGTGAPTDPKNELLHQTTQGILKRRISEGGQNYFLLGRLIIVLLYELWETGYRSPFATAASVSRGSLLVPVFGDLRLLRHEVLHNKSRLTADTLSKLEVVPRPPIESVDYDRRGIHQILMLVKAAIDELVVKWTGEDPKYRTIWRVR